MSEHYVVRVYESELKVIADETLRHRDVETGGSLFGLYAHGGGPTVFLATRPAGDAVKKRTSLELDPAVTRMLEEITWNRYGVQSIGMWHSHHWIGLMEPSSGDRERTRRYAERHQRPRYTEILANFIGDQATDSCVQLTPFFYLDAGELVRADTVMRVLPGVSPLRQALEEFRGERQIDDALRAARSLPSEAYTLGESSAMASSGWRRVLRRRGDGPPRDDFGEKADDRLEETPPVAELEAGQPADDEPVSTRKPSTGSAAEQGPEDKAERTTRRGGDLRPIPDITDYIERYIQPAMKPLGRRYHVELDLIGQNRLAVIISQRGRRSRLLLFAGWDGATAVVYGCRIEFDGRIEEWPSTRDETGSFQLEEPLNWGLWQLERRI
jgi:hypothetical protein